MAIMKPLTAHEPCSLRIMEYLTWDKDDPNKCRALAVDLYNVSYDVKTTKAREVLKRAGVEDIDVDWAAQMDNTRTRRGDDISRNGQTPVTYRHWVFSPDPRDSVSLEVMQEITQEWVAAWLTGEEYDEDGKLGCYEVACVYHDDNKDEEIPGDMGIVHAHIIMNSSNLTSDKKLHITNKQFHAMWDSAQDIAAARGLTYHVRFDEDEKERQKRQALAPTQKPPRWARGSFITETERGLKKRGKYSWKADLRDRVMIARSLSSNDRDFNAVLDKLGVNLRDKTHQLAGKTKEDYIYTLSANADYWRCSGYRLGRPLFTKEALEKHREKQLKSGLSAEDMEVILENLDTWIDTVLANAIDRVTTIEVRPDIELKKLAELLSFNEDYKIGGLDDYAKMMKRVQIRLKKPHTKERGKELTAEYNALKRANKLARESGLFDNIGYKPSSVVARMKYDDDKSERFGQIKAGKIEPKAGEVVPSYYQPYRAPVSSDGYHKVDNRQNPTIEHKHTHSI